jgi:thioredoxin-related protein
MLRSQFWHISLPIAIAVGGVMLCPAEASAQAAKKTKTKTAAPAVFTEALAKAKKDNRPLVVFGVSEGCSRCAALKQGLTTQPELQQLMAKYVSVEIPFGGRDFSDLFNDIIRQDEKYRQAIGAPSVFIFTANGAAVYAGPNDPNGMTAGDEFKKLLLAGIEKNAPSAVKPVR